MVETHKHTMNQIKKKLAGRSTKQNGDNYSHSTKEPVRMQLLVTELCEQIMLRALTPAELSLLFHKATAI